MKATMKILSLSITVGACALLLSACDGRAGQGFKSVQYTPEELAKNKAEKKALECKINKNCQEKPEELAPVDLVQRDKWETEQAAKAKALADEEARRAGKPVVVEEKLKDAPVEVDPPPADQQTPVLKVEQTADGKKTSIVASLSKVVDDRLKQNPPVVDAAARKFVQGITFYGTPHSLTMHARIQYRKQKNNLFAEKSPIAFSTDKVSPLALVEAMIDGSRQVPADDGTVQGFAFCRDSNCQTVDVVLMFTKSVLAVFELRPGAQKNEYEIVSHNLGAGLKTFKEAEVAADVDSSDAKKAELYRNMKGRISPPSDPAAAQAEADAAKAAAQAEADAAKAELYKNMKGRISPPADPDAAKAELYNNMKGRVSPPADADAAKADLYNNMKGRVSPPADPAAAQADADAAKAAAKAEAASHGVGTEN